MLSIALNVFSFDNIILQMISLGFGVLIFVVLTMISYKKSCERQNIDAPSEYLVKNIILQYGELASWKLSQISHAELSWSNSRRGLLPNENGDTPLDLNDIRKDAEKVRPYDSMWDMYLDEFEDYEE